nr:MAG: hypothetical protein [Bacteriophage sp.]
MKKYLIIAAIVLAVAAVVTIWVQRSRINQLTGERDKYRTNTETLLQDVETYQTKDSLNAAKVGVLELKLSEFERYRASDAELIKTLQTKNRELKALTNAQSQTIIDLRGTVRDSLVYVDRVVVDTLRCITAADKWFSFDGCVNRKNEFTGIFINRDSILIAATVEYKRFLNFLWKTKKVKNREIDVVSKNPHTKIIGVEYIEIEK